VAFQRITTKYFLRVLMKGHMVHYDLANKKINRCLICGLGERLIERDARSLMAPRVVV
jgi:hypothetical protein